VALRAYYAAGLIEESKNLARDYASEVCSATILYSRNEKVFITQPKKRCCVTNATSSAIVALPLIDGS
jgi:hypothetical protein